MFQVVLELAAEASLTITESGIVTSCSPAFESLFAYGPGEIIGRSAGALLPGIDLQDLESDRALELHGRGHRKDGSWFPVRVRMKRVTSSRRPLVVAVVWPLGAADERLRESQEMLKAVADHTTAVIYIKDFQGRYILVNRRYEDLFHVENEQLRGKTDYDLFPKSIADTLRANDRAVARLRAPKEFDETVPSDEELRQYISIKFPLMRPSGEVYAVCGISTDITERKRAEQQLLDTYAHLQAVVKDRTSDLSEAHERLRAESIRREGLVRELSSLIAAANEGIWIVDVHGSTTFVNVRMANMLGYAVDEMLGRPLYDFVPEERRREAKRKLGERLRGIEEQYDFEFRRKDGSSVWTLVSSNPIRDSTGHIVGGLGMLTDITDRKQSEEQQKRLLRELDHRVKNNLATVSALADLTMEKVGSLNEFRDSFGNRIQALARTHEALARARWGDIELEDLVATALAAQMGATPGRIDVAGESVPPIPPRIATPLALTLSELGANALKHGALSKCGGTIRIDWACERDGELLELTWTEHHSNANMQAGRAGTGSSLMRGLIEYELGGTLEIEHVHDGLRCRIGIPLCAGTDRADRSDRKGADA